MTELARGSSGVDIDHLGLCGAAVPCVGALVKGSGSYRVMFYDYVERSGHSRGGEVSYRSNWAGLL
jgi:hypothetical protein